MQIHCKGMYTNRYIRAQVLNNDCIARDDPTEWYQQGCVTERYSNLTQRRSPITAIGPDSNSTARLEYAAYLQQDLDVLLRTNERNKTTTRVGPKDPGAKPESNLTDNPLLIPLGKTLVLGSICRQYLVVIVVSDLGIAPE
jgi:hypothetical protein